MSHAVIRAGGKQFLVEEGQTIRVPSLEADAGSSIELEALLSFRRRLFFEKDSATVVDHGAIRRSWSSRRSAANSTSARAVTGRVTRR
jgi:ribosomal protein L21